MSEAGESAPGSGLKADLKFYFHCFHWLSNIRGTEGVGTLAQISVNDGCDLI